MAVLNLTYFGVEFAVAHIIGSVSLFADSVDFLEDTSVNFVILAALGWSAVRRARVGMALGRITGIAGADSVSPTRREFYRGWNLMLDRAAIQIVLSHPDPALACMR